MYPSHILYLSSYSLNSQSKLYNDLHTNMPQTPSLPAVLCSCLYIKATIPDCTICILGWNFRISMCRSNIQVLAFKFSGKRCSEVLTNTHRTESSTNPLYRIMYLFHICSRLSSSTPNFPTLWRKQSVVPRSRCRNLLVVIMWALRSPPEWEHSRLY